MAKQSNVIQRYLMLTISMLLSGITSAADLRDPTRPGWSPPTTTTTESKPVPNVLTAIVIGENKRMALIGERYLRVGDSHGDAKLIRIAFDYVVLQGSGGERVLRLTPLLDSRPAAAKANGS